MESDLYLIDTDGGVDDSLCISMALKKVDRHSLFFSIVFGNVSRDQAAYNLQCLLDSLDVIHSAIYLGATHAADGFFTFAKNTHGEDGMGVQSVLFMVHLSTTRSMREYRIYVI